ncbi:MAG: short-chain dehydrogenase [Acidocella sp. 20-57-95]|nr:MAG: short-chain dehydrogenase [Acidocella sp. 20-57-95]OYV59059.1 MAG: short-chain dehydrogenase [Acidocella sp. 21-58-7]HQT64193.1 SDR family oxidoreductase [Acidocella sp.]HQU04950.1 SDR family oxidoreductase [Acidocella sp.]
MDGAILITGSARRLGAALARAIAAAGYKIVLHAREKTAEAEALAVELQAGLVLGDLADPGVPERLIAEAVQQAGPLFGLINNASRFEYDVVSSVTAQSIAQHMAPNLVAPVLLTKYFAAAQTLERGVVINILDQKLTNLNPDFFAYTLSKAALAAATEMSAIALAPKIRVCGIAPGLTLISHLQTPERFEEAWRANPLQRGAAPADIARAALLILQTPSMTGTTITVDGGEHLMRRVRDVGFLGRT